MQYAIVAFYILMQKYQIYFCISCTQTIIIRSNSLEYKEGKNTNFKKTSFGYETFLFFVLFISGK